MLPFAIAGGAQALLGLGQALFSGQKKKERALEKHLDSYKPNESIMDYYNKALTKYNANPYTSQSFNQTMKQTNRNLASGLNNLQGRGAALAGVSSLVDASNMAAGRAAAQAEQQQAQDLAQLGQATGMKAAEDKYKFEGKYNLLAQKAGAASQMKNAGISNIFGGLGTMAGINSINQTYGG